MRWLRSSRGLAMFFPFPGTQANIFNIIDETIPAPFRSFQRDINELAYTPLDKTFTREPTTYA